VKQHIANRIQVALAVVDNGENQQGLALVFQQQVIQLGLNLNSVGLGQIGHALLGAGFVVGGIAQHIDSLELRAHVFGELVVVIDFFGEYLRFYIGAAELCHSLGKRQVRQSIVAWTPHEGIVGLKA